MMIICDIVGGGCKPWELQSWWNALLDVHMAHYVLGNQSTILSFQYRDVSIIIVEPPAR
jgi:hypothetical protein